LTGARPVGGAIPHRGDGGGRPRGSRAGGTGRGGLRSRFTPAPGGADPRPLDAARPRPGPGPPQQRARQPLPWRPRLPRWSRTTSGCSHPPPRHA